MSQEKLVTEILKNVLASLLLKAIAGLIYAELPDRKSKKEIEDVTYTLVQDDSRYTLRIPQDAIDANPGLLN